MIRAARLIPDPISRRLIRLVPLARLRKMVDVSDTSLHDEYYTDDYFRGDIVAPAEASAPAVGRFMIEHFRPADVIDVGCGSGEFLDEFRKAGIPGHGIELADAGLRRCREKGLDVVKLDLTGAPELPWKADLVYSFEVAEHLKESAAAHLVGLITRAARRVVCFTAAAPGQPGLGHINCQPKSYWVALFEAAGFSHDLALSESWEAENRALGLPGWFCRNILVFHAPRPPEA
jgi:SAM-dependent methyltransferase